MVRLFRLSTFSKNTPVRLGFQRRPAAEHARIVEVVVAHAIAHPMWLFDAPSMDGQP